MKQLRNIFTGLLFALGLLVSLPALAQEEITPGEQKENTVDVKSIVFGHIGDSYEEQSCEYVTQLFHFLFYFSFVVSYSAHSLQRSLSQIPDKSDSSR